MQRLEKDKVFEEVGIGALDLLSLETGVRVLILRVKECMGGCVLNGPSPNKRAPLTCRRTRKEGVAAEQVELSTPLYTLSRKKYCCLYHVNTKEGQVHFESFVAFIRIL